MSVRHVAECGFVKEVNKPAIARFMKADGAIVNTTGYVHPGTAVKVPLETIDGEQMFQSGYVASCVMISARVHRVEIRFRMPLIPEYFMVCWGVSVGDEGPTEIMPFIPMPADPDPAPSEESVMQAHRAAITEMASMMRAKAKGNFDPSEIRAMAAQIITKIDAMDPVEKTDEA